MNSIKQPLPKVVSEQEWKAARDELLAEEKELTRLRDQLNAKRRKLPMMKVRSDYVFEGAAGPLTLLDLFQGRQQLIVYHFMFGPDWSAGCEGCSWVRDAMTHPAHLLARDTSLVMASRADYRKLVDYEKRMEWSTPIPWVSSLGSDFNCDFEATTDEGEQHGASVFIRAGDDIYRTYHVGSRGVEYLGTQWSYLDLTPYGRQETWEESPATWPQTEPYAWCHRHDEYKD